MNNRIEQETLSGTDQVLKTTALLYLKEAVINEEFERCSELVDSARKYGAEENEIREVLRGGL